ncbi:MAG: UMP kinase [Candidatus Njordarchaeales archaeon]
MRVVVKIGGSVLWPERTLDKDRFISWAKVICSLAQKVDKLLVVTGGGYIAREYIRVLREAGGSSFEGDLLGIHVSRVNAFLLLSICKNLCKINAYPEVILSVNDVLRLIDFYQVFFSGGFFPGQSTAGVAAEIAEAARADIILLATNVDGIYTSDPFKDPNAKKIPIISTQELLEIIKNYEAEAGTYRLIDLNALKIIQRARIPVVVFNGNKPQEAVQIIDLVKRNDLKAVTKYGSLITP